MRTYTLVCAAGIRVAAAVLIAVVEGTIARAPIKLFINVEGMTECAPIKLFINVEGTTVHIPIRLFINVEGGRLCASLLIKHRTNVDD
jgi:hypothetical protein